MRIHSASFALALFAFGPACATRLPEPRKLAEAPAPTVTETSPPRELPPPSGTMRHSPFPEIARGELSNGLGLAVVEARALPLVQIRLVVRAGKGTDGDLTGLSRLTALWLKDGGTKNLASHALLERIESLGTNLSVRVGPDIAVFAMAVPKRHFEEALSLMGQVVLEPRFDEIEFRKLKMRERARVLGQAKSSGAWAASMLLYRELYRLPTHLHPYASYDALPKELDRIEPKDARAHHRQFYSPKNASLVLAGDIDASSAKEVASRVFGSWKGNDAPSPSFASPVPREELTIWVADRPGSAQSDVYLGFLGPERRDEDYTPLSVANQILGGGVAGRLFLDVREKLSLAYRTSSSLGERARGPVPLVLYAGTQTAKTGLAAQALLAHAERLSNEAPTTTEVEIARRYLADVMAVRMETTSALADMVVALDTYGLPDDHYDTHREALRSTTVEEAFAASAGYLRPDHAVLVVAGDAERIAPMLARFGEVRIVDPEQAFARRATIPANPSASLEIERTPGE